MQEFLYTRIKFWTFLIHVEIWEVLNEFIVVLSFSVIMLFSAFVQYNHC